jgi:hypothetical protein
LISKDSCLREKGLREKGEIIRQNRLIEGKEGGDGLSTEGAINDGEAFGVGAEADVGARKEEGGRLGVEAYDALGGLWKLLRFFRLELVQNIINNNRFVNNRFVNGRFVNSRLGLHEGRRWLKRGLPLAQLGVN